MEKTYKSRPYRILLHLFYGILGTAFIGLIVYNFLGAKYAIGGAILFAILYLWLVIFDCFIKIIVKDGKMIVVKGKKEQEFIIDKCSFRATTTTSSGETSCKLTVIDPNGQDHSVDCELIGIKQFNQLLEDLGVLGEHAKAEKIITRRRTES